MKYLLAILVLFNIGCESILFDSLPRYRLQLKQDGYHPYHCDSCGPTCVEKILKHFNINIPHNDISNKIIEDRSIDKHIIIAVLAVIDKYATLISFPEELVYHLSKHKINVEIIDKDIYNRLYYMLINNEIGFVLGYETDDIFTMHYTAFSSNEEIDYLINQKRYKYLKLYICRKE